MSDHRHHDGLQSYRKMLAEADEPEQIAVLMVLLGLVVAEQRQASSRVDDLGTTVGDQSVIEETGRAASANDGSSRNRDDLIAADPNSRTQPSGQKLTQQGESRRAKSATSLLVGRLGEALAGNRLLQRFTMFLHSRHLIRFSGLKPFRR
jgi:hypothetical protein